MDILRHVLIALTYTAFAVALAATLPYNFPNLAGSDALLIGGLFFVISALLHEVFARFERDGAMDTQLAAFDELRDELTEEIQRARREVTHVHALVEDSHGKSPKKMGDIVAEVRTLQTLVEKLSSKGQDAAVEAPAKPAAKHPAKKSSIAANATGMGPEAVLELVQDALRRDRIDLFLQPVVALPQRQPTFARTMDPSSRRIFI